MLTITLAATMALCEDEARRAGELMALRQSGAARSQIEAVADGYQDPVWATQILPELLDAETSDDPEVRELAAYHFAALAHARCTGGL
jgi:hypothetical protein